MEREAGEMERVAGERSDGDMERWWKWRGAGELKAKDKEREGCSGERKRGGGGS